MPNPVQERVLLSRKRTRKHASAIVYGSVVHLGVEIYNRVQMATGSQAWWGGRWQDSPMQLWRRMWGEIHD